MAVPQLFLCGDQNSFELHPKRYWLMPTFCGKTSCKYRPKIYVNTSASLPPSPPFSPNKQVHIFSYQCSQLSTSKSVIEVFNTAKRFQRNQDTSKYVSVVVLDEVGLAEDSPNLPLKALHPLLEDGTEGADSKEEVRSVRENLR